MSHDRSRFLGGSDVAAVLGVSHYRTPLELWQEKTGRKVFEADPEEARRKSRGQKLEPFIVEMAVEKLREQGHTVEIITRNARYFDPSLPFLSCEIDAELEVDGQEVNFDAKSASGTTRLRWGEEGTDQVPLEYAAQFMHGLGITARPKTLVAALRSFDDVELYEVPRDELTIQAMREKCVLFWRDCVEADRPPDPITFADCRELWPEGNGKRVEATDEVLALIDELRQVADRKKTLANREEWLRFELARFMGPAEVISKGVRDLVSWAPETRSSFDEQAFRREHPDWAALFTKPRTTRVLRIARRR